VHLSTIVLTSCLTVEASLEPGRHEARHEGTEEPYRSESAAVRGRLYVDDSNRCEALVRSTSHLNGESDSMCSMRRQGPLPAAWPDTPIPASSRVEEIRQGTRTARRAREAVPALTPLGPAGGTSGSSVEGSPCAWPCLPSHCSPPA
jgi:hypothetical protein